jgi:hypothetical protein
MPSEGEPPMEGMPNGRRAAVCLCSKARSRAITSMSFVHTERPVIYLRAALFATLVLSSPLFAATSDSEAGLTRNERAAQDAIVQSPSSATVPNDTRTTTLANSENAAQRAISDVDASHGPAIAAAIGEPKLMQNERAAQRAIVDVPRPKRGSSAVTTSASLLPAATAQPRR